MTITLDAYRRFFAEEIEAAAGLRTPALVDAFATVPRERFLGEGPWIVKGVDGDFWSTRATPDADARRAYHNVAIALDPARQLFNGQPGTIGAWIDALALEPRSRVLHVGAGTGYYTGLMAHCVGTEGRVLALEADPRLAARALANLAQYPQVDVRCADGTTVDATFDAILVNAGVTHPLDAWLDALAPGGRMIVPITFAFAPAPIGKGIVVLLTRRTEDPTFDARLVGFVAIYSAVGVRDERLSERIGAALKSNPMPRLTALRRDAHDPSAACWLHGETCCFQAAPIAKHERPG